MPGISSLIQYWNDHNKSAGLHEYLPNDYLRSCQWRQIIIFRLELRDDGEGEEKPTDNNNR